MKDKKAVSPVIATVLLIGITIALAGIVFIWAQGFVKEGAQKRGEPIERACDSVIFEADVSLNVSNQNQYLLEVNNKANIPIYGFDVKKLGEGKVIVHEILGQTIDVGNSARIDLTSADVNSRDELLVVPILLGARGDVRESHTCADQFGVGVTVP